MQTIASEKNNMKYFIHNLGFPRIGARRELKTAVEAYWAGKTTQLELEQVVIKLREQHWKQQQEPFLDVTNKMMHPLLDWIHCSEWHVVVRQVVNQLLHVK